MTQGMNKATLIGNLGADPELRYTHSGKAILGLRLATTTTYGTGEGKPRKEDTQWHRISLWGKRAEALHKHLAKGDPVAVEGRITYNKYTDKDGVERYSTDIVANDMFLLKQKKKAEERSDAYEPPEDEDIPF